MTEALWAVACGTVPYQAAREAQKALEQARLERSVPDVLLLLEHPPVLTRGRRSEAGELPMGVEWYEAQGIEVCDTDRGGRVTYHGPGQLVAYPIVDLGAYGNDVVAYVRRLESVIIGALGDHGVGAGVVAGLTGVWTDGGDAPAADATADSVAAAVAGARMRKIASIGIHVRRGVTTHGLAVNVSNDLQPFEWIVPCGIDGCRMTSVSREVGTEIPVDGFADMLTGRFASQFGRRVERPSAAEVAERVPGAAALSRAAGPRPLPLMQ